MIGNRKDWHWCKWGKHWVFDFPFAASCGCGECYLALCNRDKSKAEAKEAIQYLERDYAKQAI